MDLIYNSPTYTVVKYMSNEHVSFEIIDKMAKRQSFITDSLAEKFQASVEALMGEESVTIQDFDEFVESWDGLMVQRVVLH